MATYHLGKDKVKAVAIEKASEVCPDGNDRLPAATTVVKLGSVSTGLFLLMVIFNR